MKSWKIRSKGVKTLDVASHLHGQSSRTVYGYTESRLVHHLIYCSHVLPHCELGTVGEASSGISKKVGGTGAAGASGSGC